MEAICISIDVLKAQWSRTKLGKYNFKLTIGKRYEITMLDDPFGTTGTFNDDRGTTRFLDEYELGKVFISVEEFNKNRNKKIEEILS